MTEYTTFTSAVKKWTARPDFSDDLLATFVRSAETFIDRKMRVKEAVVFTPGTLTVDGNIVMPDNYNELMFIAPTGGKPLHYEPYDNFQGMSSTSGKFTRIGTTIICGSDMASKNVEYAYYQNVPAFTSAATWLYTKYYDIFLQATIIAALAYAQEWERSISLSELVSGWIEEANENSRMDKVSGSPLIRRVLRRIG